MWQTLTLLIFICTHYSATTILCVKYDGTELSVMVLWIKLNKTGGIISDLSCFHHGVDPVSFQVESESLDRLHNRVYH